MLVSNFLEIEAVVARYIEPQLLAVPLALLVVLLVGFCVWLQKRRHSPTEQLIARRFASIRLDGVD